MVGTILADLDGRQEWVLTGRLPFLQCIGIFYGLGCIDSKYFSIAVDVELYVVDGWGQVSICSPAGYVVICTLNYSIGVWMDFLAQFVSG